MPIQGPIIGIVDGSNAAPGMVGEYVQQQVSVTYPVGPANTVTPVSGLVLQPGDWNIYAYCQTTGFVEGLVFEPSPAPVGLSPGLAGSSVNVPGSGTTTPMEYPIINGFARGNFTVPTLLAFSIQVVTGTGQVAGTAFLTISARRAR